ncbi:glycosyltransferase [Erythrobacteraceae bacterium CFH 75059]|uniref:glycosyltransferase family 4 protein n=1 Tax=Qipengyuania thermophila TaxID=2509361 RepID=UPI00101FB827|nr:glycosyltransferase family 4 protein [Qipengyuania thermophila]TCD04859.1 glycosyltransferase [Erythrobacteraceae bacterium CFH 75059]
MTGTGVRAGDPSRGRRLRLLFALSGFHRIDRGAETALLRVAQELAGTGAAEVVVAGSGLPRADTAYRFVHVPSPGRERFERLPALPPFRNETHWEDAAFALRLSRLPLGGFDATLTCAYPFTNWILRRHRSRAPAHIFVTQNGDWPALAGNAEYRWFGCDGLVCTNPEYFARNRDRWNAALIPNGIDLERFAPGAGDRARFALPAERPVVLMVSALMDTKRVLDGIRAMAAVPDAMLVVAGDGPLRDEAERLAAQMLPGRYRRLEVPAGDMPLLYRSADVFLHLSKVESFGNVYLEAGATGLPIVAHDCGLTRWILGGDAPGLIDTDDLGGVSAALRDALGGRNSCAPDLARFAWPRIAAAYAEFVTATVARRRHEKNSQVA